MRRVKLPREESLVLPTVQNPFVHNLNLTWLDYVQIILMSVTVVPVRLIFIALFLVLGWFFAAIAMAGRTPEEEKEPMSGWRKSIIHPLERFCIGAIFFVSGFQKVEIVGQQATVHEAPVLCVAPHSTFFDTIIGYFTGLPSGISRIENGQAPLFGTLTKFTQPVFVSREDPNSRQNTIKEIQRRARSKGKWPQIIVFPEGTCTNRTCLITFKQGAFCPGVPVQPVCLKYKNRLDTVTWTWDGPGAFTCLWLTLCQLNTNLEIEYLPVYSPSEEEQQNAKLFGENVRTEMAKCLGIPVTDHTFEDCRLMNYAAKLDFPAASGLVEFNKLAKKLGMNFDNIKELLGKFCSFAQQNKGSVTMEEFADYLGLPVSEALKEMFALYDRDGSGTIDFREYVIGLSLIATPVNTEETIQLAFQVFDKGAKGYITETELTTMLHDSFGMDEVDTARLFAQVDADKDGKITYGEFKVYAEQKPEYAKLFVSFQEKRNNIKPTASNNSSSENLDPSKTKTE